MLKKIELTEGEVDVLDTVLKLALRGGSSAILARSAAFASLTKKVMVAKAEVDRYRSTKHAKVISNEPVPKP